VFKAVTAMSALELGILSPTELIDVVADHPVRTCSRTSSTKTTVHSLATALECLGHLLLQVGARFWNLHGRVSQTNNPNAVSSSRLAERFGFGATTGIDLPDETRRVPTPLEKVVLRWLGQPRWRPGAATTSTWRSGRDSGDAAADAVAIRRSPTGEHGDADDRMDITNQSGQIVRHCRV